MVHFNGDYVGHHCGWFGLKQIVCARGFSGELN